MKKYFPVQIDNRKQLDVTYVYRAPQKIKFKGSNRVESETFLRVTEDEKLFSCEKG